MTELNDDDAVVRMLNQVESLLNKERVRETPGAPGRTDGAERATPGDAERPVPDGDSATPARAPETPPRDRAGTNPPRMKDLVDADGAGATPSPDRPVEDFDPDATEPDMDPVPEPPGRAPGAARTEAEPDTDEPPEATTAGEDSESARRPIEARPDPDPEERPQAEALQARQEPEPEEGPGEPLGATSVAAPTATADADPPRAPAAAPESLPEGGRMARRLTTRLGQLLLDAGLLSRTQLESALQKQRESGERLGAVLVNEGFIEETALLSILEEQYGVPAARLDEIEIDPAAVALVPREMAQRYHLVPFARRGDTVDVAMADPTDFVAMAHVRFATGLRPNAFIATANAVERAFARLDDESDGVVPAPGPVCSDPRTAIKRMILDRDSRLMAADQDPRTFYELAASIDEFVDEILARAQS